MVGPTNFDYISVNVYAKLVVTTDNERMHVRPCV